MQPWFRLPPGSTNTPDLVLSCATMARRCQCTCGSGGSLRQSLPATKTRDMKRQLCYYGSAQAWAQVSWICAVGADTLLFTTHRTQPVLTTQVLESPPCRRSFCPRTRIHREGEGKRQHTHMHTHTHTRTHAHTHTHMNMWSVAPSLPDTINAIRYLAHGPSRRAFPTVV